MKIGLGKEIKIEPLTRVEGHGQVIVRINVKDRKLKEVEFSVIESPRFFEKLLEGKPAEEAPRMTERICGICFVDHHLASVKAVEDAWGATIPETALKLRKTIHYADFITSHVLHIAFLCLPDLVNIKERNFLELAKVNPNLVKLAINLHEYGNKVVGEIGGRIVHPVTAIPGGMAKPLTEEQKTKLLTETSQALKDVKKLADKTLKLMEEKIEILNYPVTGTYYMGLVSDGWHEIYDGNLKVMDEKGNLTYQFKAQEYLEYIAEKVSEHSFVKLPFLKKIGFPQGIYRVGPLARLNIMEKISGTLTQDYIKSFMKIFGKPSNHLMAYNAARVIEIVNAVESVHEFLGDKKITSENVRAPVKEKRGVGVGVVEAPRGILIHNYQTNDDGIIVNANIISPTTHNAPSIEATLKALAEHQMEELLKPKNDEALWRMETLVRAYDPCISCATHLVRVVKE